MKTIGWIIIWLVVAAAIYVAAEGVITTQDGRLVLSPAGKVVDLNGSRIVNATGVNDGGEGAGNIVFNGNMGLGAAGWSLYDVGYGNLVMSTDNDTPTGTGKSLKLTKTSDNRSLNFRLYQQLPEELMEDNATYTLSFYYKTNSDFIPYTGVNYDYYYASGNTYNPALTADEKWHKESYTFKLEPGRDAHYINFVPWGTAGATGVYLKLAGITLTKGAIEKPWTPSDRESLGDHEVKNRLIIDGAGAVLTSPDGTKWCLKIDNTGALKTTRGYC